MIRKVNGRSARFYITDDGDYIAVTYHKRVRGRLRQLTVSPKLLRRFGVPQNYPASGTMPSVPENERG